MPAQINEGTFISGSFGGYAGSSNQLRLRNAPSIVLSTGLGIPLLDRVYLYTKLSYISRSNYTAQEQYNTIGPDLNTVSKMIEADASFSQLLFNGGLQYNIYISDDLTLGINSGLTYVLVNHKAALPNGTLLQELDNTGVFGFFGGLNLEKFFEDSNVSFYGEAQYNYTKKNMIYFRDKFSGMNFTVGGRFYVN
jgi:hypothetical protein